MSRQQTGQRVPFTKMHGLGNDFMVLDTISNPVELSPDQVRMLGDRRRGVGFDQLLIIGPPGRPDADFNYRIFNPDGSEVEHCGNGARCFARYVLNRGLIARNPIRVETMNRMLELHVREDGQITVDMGAPDFEPTSLPFTAPARQDFYTLSVPVAPGSAEQTEAKFQAVSMGNPHIVLTVDDCENAPVNTLGAVLCTWNKAFPQGVNVGFMQIIDRSTIRLRVFERGAGETEACGTGTCAAVVCGIQAGLLDSQVRAILNGGELHIEWHGEGHPVLMTGPAAHVYEGTVLL
ncbi:MAG TPA: diaminopimelate epimerase [Pseudohongiella sp.]|nr:diaminopimelate epimerase [Pseudohongiella sp.]